tara:strand:- start:3344 stop:3484 length:141 start_codon:yes stop_codon:yes gene_type:complete
MRFLSRVVPDFVVDAAIIGSLVVGTIALAPKVVYYLLVKDGVFNDD